MDNSPKHFLIIDSEFLHQDYKDIEIIQLAALKCNHEGYAVGTFNRFIRTPRQDLFTPRFEALFGYDWHYLEQTGHAASSVFNEFTAFAKDCTLIFSHGGEYPLLAEYSTRHTLPLPLNADHYKDIAPFFMEKRGGHYCRSGELAESFGLPFHWGTRHDAMIDCLSLYAAMQVHKDSFLGSHLK